MTYLDYKQQYAAYTLDQVRWTLADIKETLAVFEGQENQAYNSKLWEQWDALIERKLELER